MSPDSSLGLDNLSQPICAQLAIITAKFRSELTGFVLSREQMMFMCRKCHPVQLQLDGRDVSGQRSGHLFIKLLKFSVFGLNCTSSFQFVLNAVANPVRLGCSSVTADNANSRLFGLDTDSSAAFRGLSTKP